MLAAEVTRIVDSDGALVRLMRFCTGRNELLCYHLTLKDEFQWLDLVAYHPSVLDIRFVRCDMCPGATVESAFQDLVEGWVGVTNSCSWI